MCGYFCIGFIDFMLAGKIFTDYTNLFSPNFNCFKCNIWRSITYFIYKCYLSTSWNSKCKFLFNTWNSKKIIEYNKKKEKKKHDKILMLAKIKLNSIDTLIS